MFVLVSVILIATEKPEPSTLCLVIGKSPCPYAAVPNNAVPYKAPLPDVANVITLGCGVFTSS